jgi:hypothetical protein
MVFTEEQEGGAGLMVNGPECFIHQNTVISTDMTHWVAALVPILEARQEKLGP